MPVLTLTPRTPGQLQATYVGMETTGRILLEDGGLWCSDTLPCSEARPCGGTSDPSGGLLLETFFSALTPRAPGLLTLNARS